MTDSIRALQDKKAFICDMDGVIYHGNKIIPHVSEFVNLIISFFISSTSNYTPFLTKNQYYFVNIIIFSATI